MLDKPRIVQTERSPTAVIHLTIPRDRIREVMGPAIAEVMSVVQSQGIGPAGPLYAHYFATDDDSFDMVVGVPITGELQPSGRVQAGELPEAMVARVNFRGPYEDLHDGWAKFDEWIRLNRHIPRQDLWERYLKGPESGPDSSQWVTELNRPLENPS